MRVKEKCKVTCLNGNPCHFNAYVVGYCMVHYKMAREKAEKPKKIGINQRKVQKFYNYFKALYWSDQERIIKELQDIRRSFD